jgi:hypothetical protein
MPYVYYEELPEGAEAADVVSHEHYDTLAEELAATVEQRDQALETLEDSRRETREAKAKYAKYILDSNKQQGNPKEPEDEPKPKGKTVADLFAIEK